MELIIKVLPIIFFLFSVFEAQKTSKVVGYGNQINRLPKNWVRIESNNATDDGLKQLEYLSETAYDLSRNKNRAKYQYTKSL